MSAIQKLIENQNHNYIYLYKNNYLIRPKEKPMKVFSQIKKSVLKNIQQKNSQIELDKIESKYNEGRNLLLGLLEGGESEDNQLQRKFIEILNEKLPIDIEEKFNIDFNTLSISSKQGSSAGLSAIKKIKTKTKEDASLAKNNYVTIQRRINQLKEQIDSAIKNFKTDESTKEKLNFSIKQIEILEKELVKIFEMGIVPENKTSFYNMLKDVGLPVPKQVWAKHKSNFYIKGKRMDNDTANNIRKVLNGIIIHSIKGYEQLILGDLLELFAYAAFELADDVAEKTLEKNLKNFFKSSKSGSNQTMGTVNIIGNEDILKSLLQEVSHNKINLGGSNIKAEIKYYSQQKADLIVTVDNKQYGISAKNYKDTQFKGKNKNITLSSGSPLITHLLGANELHPLASRNFLNILAGESKEDSVSSGYKTIKNSGLDTLSLVILWQAATGRGIGKEQGYADILMWNDNKTGTVRFFDINTILEKISNSNAQGIINPNLNQIQLTNTKIYSKGGTSEGIKARLSKALHEAHEKKIHASIPMDLLKNLSAK